MLLALASPSDTILGKQPVLSQLVGAQVVWTVMGWTTHTTPARATMPWVPNQLNSTKQQVARSTGQMIGGPTHQ